MNHAEAVERAAAHARRLFKLPPETQLLPGRDLITSSSRETFRADVAEVLDASGYPAALTEAAEILRAFVDLLHPKWRVEDCQHALCVRARVWLADHEGEE